VSDRLEVVAALLRRDDRFLLARRVKDDPIGRVWEFPGGRVEAGEKLEEALARELREELGIEARVGRKAHETEHDYPHLSLRLHFFHCELAGGEPLGLEGQDLRWTRAEEMAAMEFPEADREMVRLLAVGN